MLQWLRRYLSADQREIEALARRVGVLERAEVEREAAVADTIDKLTRYYKRIRQRQKIDQDDGDDRDSRMDPITEAVLRRRAGGGHLQLESEQ